MNTVIPLSLSMVLRVMVMRSNAIHVSRRQSNKDDTQPSLFVSITFFVTGNLTTMDDFDDFKPKNTREVWGDHYFIMHVVYDL